MISNITHDTEHPGISLAFSIISLILGASFYPIPYSSFSYPRSGPCSLLAKPIPVAMVTVATVALLTQEGFVIRDHSLVYVGTHYEIKRILAETELYIDTKPSNLLHLMKTDRKKIIPVSQFSTSLCLFV